LSAFLIGSLTHPVQETGLLIPSQPGVTQRNPARNRLLTLA